MIKEFKKSKVEIYYKYLYSYKGSKKISFDGLKKEIYISEIIFQPAK